MSIDTKQLTHVQRESREQERRPLEFGLIRRLMGYTRPYRRRRNVLLLLVVVRAVQLPLLAWAIGSALGGPIARADGRGVILGALGYALLSAATQWTLCYRSLLALQLGEDVLHDLRDAMFGYLHRQTMAFFNNTRVGRIVSRFTTDAGAVRVGIQDVLFVSMVNLGQMLVAAALMLWYDPVLFLVVAGVTPVLWLFNRLFRRRLGQAYRAVQESFSRVTATLAESVSGIRVTQGFSRENLNAGLFAELAANHSRYNIDVARAAGTFLPLLEFNTQLFIAAVLMIGGWRVFQGRTEVAALYQFVLLSNIFFAPVQSLGSQLNNALSAMAGAERIFRLLDRQPEWEDPPGALRPSLKGHVEFRDLGFAYDPARPVLQGISFSAEPGHIIALVGHTGSGKTTIINLIAKFYLPSSGVLLIDGHDIRKLDSDALHRQTGIVLQQNFLFTGTVMDNIRIGRPNASDGDVLTAAERIDCRELIEALPEGFQTHVGEGGAGISLGQRQLICLTRAMLANPRILILDEATSSIDTLTEARIQKALGLLLRGRTSFVVAHRLSTIRHADCVLVLDNGRIAERGTHEALVRTGGIYAGLYREFVKAASNGVSSRAALPRPPEG